MAAIFCLLAGVTGCEGGPEPAPVVEQPDAAPSATDGSGPAAPTPAPEPSELPDPAVTAESAAGLGVPWAMALLPDGTLIITERDTAEVKRLVDGRVEVIGVVEDALSAGGEGGLLGVAVPPDFSDVPRLYLYYTSPTDNRVVSMSYDGNGLGETAAVLTGIPRANIHNGGRIKFGPDGYLYIGTGDASNASLAQDPASLGGKILRVTADGAPAPGNPFDSAVYSLGHRNVQGLAWDSTGRLWASEFGPDRDDELNLIVPGGNYGWPLVTGAPGEEGFLDARVVWPSTATSSPSGMAIVGDVAYIGGLRGERLWRVPLADGSAGEPASFFDGAYGRLRDTIAGEDGGLLIATNETGGSRILRVEMQ
ncbi:PQQ-dependent sugar dehydrogenase [Arthrobacter subterraneus]|uniref:PQQ-dependent sugar dehydrogenase n=1 Tax=Arthrobacter subterraneus TaxID=335973 RepID=UPI003805382C